ncbi:hypothetical protein F3Y22_tig00112471pilonHSYRG00107 [Hibiscus syriacus]|uniref:RNase H type-1 domain-containing protein n=1 Tax=Hibiscus syriacus TaxID=106335 RepID=A0A6A2Y9M9_HIBSY|nr:hypothetical protein F3Y22_tig00112471pilonHSYRG00107 [Hibiscus syriacus]
MHPPIFSEDSNVARHRISLSSDDVRFMKKPRCVGLKPPDKGASLMEADANPEKPTNPGHSESPALQETSPTTLGTQWSKNGRSYGLWWFLSLWKRRNSFIFNDSCSSIDDTLRQSIVLASYCNMCRLPLARVKSRQLMWLKWRPPTKNWSYLKVDASVNISSGDSSIGGVLRTNQGDRLIGFHKRLGIMTPLMVELWSIYIGLQVTWSFGTELVQIQADNKQVVHLILDLNVGYIPLARDIIKLCSRSWYTDFCWILHEENMVANVMTKLECPNDYLLRTFLSVPSEVHLLLTRDVHGSDYPRVMLC